MSPVKTIQRIQDDVFTAIAHPVRRQLLDLLTEGPRPAARLAEPFAASRPAISQHLRVLRDAGLVSEQRQGRERIYSLQPDGLAGARRRHSRYRGSWKDKLAELAHYLEES